MEIVGSSIRNPKYWLYMSLMLLTVFIVSYYRLGIALKVLLPISLLFIIGTLVDFPRALGLAVIPASIMSVMIIEHHIFLRYWYRLSLADVMVFVQGLFFIVYWTMHRERSRIKDVFAVPLMLFAIAAMISIVVSPDRLASMAYVSLLLIGYLFYRYMLLVFESAEDLKLMAGAAVVALALVVVWSFFTESSAPGQMRAGIYLATRAGFVFAGPNGLAGVIVLLLPFTIIAFSVRSAVLRVGAVLMFAAAVYLLSMTYSRNGYISFVVSTITMIFMFTRTRRRSVLLGSVMLLVVGTLVLFLGRDFFLRLISVTMFQVDPSALLRLIMWKSALNEFVAHPLTGIGIANFYHATRILHIGFCHNLYLNTFAETGLLGGIAVILLMTVIFRRLILTFRRLDEGFLKQLNICLVGSWVAFAFNSMFDQIYFFFDRTAEMKFFWFLLAMTAVFLRVTKDRPCEVS